MRYVIDGELFEAFEKGAALVQVNETMGNWYVLMRSSKQQLEQGELRFVQFKKLASGGEFERVGAYNVTEAAAAKQYATDYQRDMYESYTGEPMPDLSKKGLLKGQYDNLVILGILPPPEKLDHHPSLKGYFEKLI